MTAHGAGDVAAVVGGEQHVHRGELSGLAGSTERGVLAEGVTFSLGIVEGMSGVQTGPGATLFTRIPRSPAAAPGSQ